MLSAELDDPGPAGGGVEARRSTAAAFDRLVADIRELPGFASYIHPDAQHLAIAADQLGDLLG